MHAGIIHWEHLIIFWKTDELRFFSWHFCLSVTFVKVFCRRVFYLFLLSLSGSEKVKDWLQMLMTRFQWQSLDIKNGRFRQQLCSYVYVSTWDDDWTWHLASSCGLSNLWNTSASTWWARKWNSKNLKHTTTCITISNQDTTAHLRLFYFGEILVSSHKR